MFARAIETTAKPGKREELIAAFSKNVLPLVRKQTGFVGVIGLANDIASDETAGLSFWKTKNDAEAFFSSAEFTTAMDGLKPLIADLKVRTFTVAASTFNEIAAGIDA